MGFLILPPEILITCSGEDLLACVLLGFTILDSNQPKAIERLLRSVRRKCEWRQATSDTCYSTAILLSSVDAHHLLVRCEAEGSTPGSLLSVVGKHEMRT